MTVGLVLLAISHASALHNSPPRRIVGGEHVVSRRAASLGLLASLVVAAPHRAAATVAAENLGGLNAGARKLSEAGVGGGEDDLVAELLRRTEANKERNRAIVKQTTEANAFTAIDGSVDRRLVTDLDGKNTYLDAREIRTLTQQRRLACAPSVMEPCRMIVPGGGDSVPELQLPEAKELRCDYAGRNCKFKPVGAESE